MTDERKRFEGKVAVVTAATKGIGLGIVRRLVAEGATVIGGARGEEGLRIAEAELGSAFIGITTDVTRQADVERLVSTAVERFGKIDLGFNVAGGGDKGTILDLSDEDFQATIDLSLKSVFFGMKSQARQMLKQGTGGAIVNISSINSFTPLYGGGSYSSTKAAVDMLTKNAALELTSKGIRINSLLPGLTETPATAPFRDDPALKAKFMERIAIGRVADPSEMAGPALFLASDDASYVCGATLVVDGGWTLTAYPDLSSWY